jgi:hypothetical protein
MESANGVQALLYTRRPDGTFDNPEVLEDFSIRVCNGGEVVAEAALKDLSVRTYKDGHVDMRELEEELRAEEQARTSSEGFVVRKECQIVPTPTVHPWCYRNTCTPGPDFYCQLISVGLGGGNVAAFCLCQFQQIA